MSLPFEVIRQIGPVPDNEMLFRCYSDDLQATLSWLDETFPNSAILERGRMGWPSAHLNNKAHFTLHLSGDDAMLLKLMK